MFRLIFLILLSALIFSCGGKSSTQPVVIARDTTIHDSVAYTMLSLDSTSVESYLSAEVPAEDLIGRIRNFYNARNFQYAWFDEQGLVERGKAFWNLHLSRPRPELDSTERAKQLHSRMELLVFGDTTFSPEIIRNIEIDLTIHFMRIANSVFTPGVNPEDVQWHIPRRKIDEAAMLDSFLVASKTGWRPMNQAFYRLNEKMSEYALIGKEGGWPEITLGKKKFNEGDKDSLIALVKQRLIISGNFDKTDTSEVFTPTLTEAVKRMQRSYGIKETGIIDQSLVSRLNVPVEERLKQMKINLERMRWMPQERDGILVNIPEFRLHVFEAGAVVMSMNIVVGKTATGTVIFSDQMENVVFSPYWNVPSSIVRNEMLGRLTESYLRKNNMEIVGNSGGLPIVRQKPGPGNSLGKVKFIFPNRYNIYLHDTPSKELFKAEKRTFSHGCIRIENPFELAQYLLRNQPAWTDEKIREAMNSKQEKGVKLPAPVPVYIAYFTSWVDREGVLNLRDDIYGHDKRMESHLFKP